MKRILTILAATLLLTAAMAGTASASSYDSVAEELSAIGVFRGTAGGFELDRAPTRSEAAIMLVRLYGAEDEAKAAYEAGEISMPFTDVSETAAPSVAWLYSQGITNGTSATTFGASSPCSAKMYCAFLLRALGYEDGVDFLYADTLDFAMLHGLFNLSMLDAAPFLRDDLAAVTYQGCTAWNRSWQRRVPLCCRWGRISGSSFPICSTANVPVLWRKSSCWTRPGSGSFWRTTMPTPGRAARRTSRAGTRPWTCWRRHSTSGPGTHSSG